MFIKTINILLITIVLPTSIYSQVLWNDPPEYITYAGRNIEIILPPPQNFTASITINNQVLLQWDEYWTDNFKVHYKNRFDYEAIPNRFSFYRQNITDGGNLDALIGVDWEENEYIDTTVEFGKEYRYKFLASDLNYITIGGYQHWSPRSLPTTITIGQNQSSLSYPSNFNGGFIPNPASIKLTWNLVSNATSYTIFKSYIDPITSNFVYLSIPVPNVNEYEDVQLIPNQTYYYQIIAINGNVNSNRSSTIAITAGTLDFQAPNNFSGYYEPDSAMIILSWNYINDANSYIIFKSFKDPTNSNEWQHLTIPVGNVNHYFDTNLLQYVGYVYTIIAVNGNTSSNRTNPLTISSGTLSIEAEEYWEAVEEYEQDRKVGWFGCSLNK